VRFEKRATPNPRPRRAVRGARRRWRARESRRLSRI